MVIFNLIKNYRDPYIVNSDGKKIYRSGVTFEQICSLFELLYKTINSEVNRHCSLFPQDITYLGQILNMNIIPTHSVWITENSDKYHSSRHCSGIKSAIEIDIDEATEQGYIPCKKCNK